MHKTGARAENRVEAELLAGLRRVRGKEGILFRLAEAAVDHPGETVRRALYPAAGEATPRDLVAGARASEAAFKTRVRKALRSSYSSCYRRMLPRLPGALQFRSNNTAHQPVIGALGLLRRYASRPGTVRFYASDEAVSLAGVVPAGWEAAVAGQRGRVERIPCELCVLRALRDGLRRREARVAGATRWRDPEADLPAGFEASREVRYTALRQPLDPSAATGELRRRMRTALASLGEAMAAGDTGGVPFTTRRGEAWISVPKLGKLPEPVNLDRLKHDVGRRWGTIDLPDFLKEADFLTGFTAELTSVASREVTDRATVRRRLLLACFAPGTNTGINALAGSLAEMGEAAGAGAALRRVRWLYLNRDSLRRAIVRVVNATFAVRDTALRGEGAACAPDSKKSGSWESNLMSGTPASTGVRTGSRSLALAA
ncbi:MAG: Tn3 family transposase [Streptosporangiaceae bacterium]